MISHKHVLSRFILLVAFIFLSYGRVWPCAISYIYGGLSLRWYKEESLLEIIGKIQTHEEMNVQFYQEHKGTS